MFISVNLILLRPTGITRAEIAKEAGVGLDPAGDRR
jgi:hypothetical protein